MTRASVVVEKLGIPTVTMLCSGFVTQGKFTAKGLEMPNLPWTIHPGHVNLVEDEKLRQTCAGPMLEQVIQGLTIQPEEPVVSKEPNLRDVVFEGDFDEVQEHFLNEEWTDGLPIVPPTLERVEKFLQYTDRKPEEVVGNLLPDNREATIWSIAVNGVMSGCRPEYMPVLIAIVEGMVDPEFGVEHLGHTPGTETLIVVNGPIVKELKFNYTQAALRPGFQANTSIGRFWRMMLRNVAGFIPHRTDKGCFGGNFRIVLAENEDACAELGWQPMNTDFGFAPGTNTVTISSCTEMTQAIEVGGPTADEILRNICARIEDNQIFVQFFFRGMRTRPTIVLTPATARLMADAGYDKAAVKKFFYENAKLRVGNLSGMILNRFYKGVNDGNWPEQIGTSFDVDRRIQLTGGPEDYMIVVSGDPDRDHVMVCSQNGYIGFPVSKKVELPEAWAELPKK
ncbi:hypothetical protein H7F51_10075 [Novosphingobium flavum]|uniref:UGSC-like domain-containing protein n=1 Tax=Novosphingobium flavum TaxID=1778672 RepID=A0A7X1FT48_9SPHN|nr:hypothetical protein [Novosphingobium flavum]MBC2665872.1 hypothetical protein [Novosphingobium flavum]